MARTPIDTLFTVYVPARPDVLRDLAPGSSIVAGDSQLGRETMLVHYEGNVYGAENLRRFVQRVHNAADRAAYRAPTIAMAAVATVDLIAVARFDLAAGELTEVLDATRLAAHLGDEPVPEAGANLRG